MSARDQPFAPVGSGSPLSDDSEFIVRAAGQDGLDFFFEQCLRQKWNICPGDLEIFHTLDPGGFLTGEYQSERIACVTGFRYDESYAYIGYYAVVAEFRGKGLGLRLFGALLERLATCSVVALDCAPLLLPMYEKSGFREIYRNIRYSGKGTKGSSPALPTSTDDSWYMCPVSEFSRKDDVVRYDSESKSHCVPREALMRALLSQLDGFVVTSEIAESKGDVIGYGLIRRALDGWRCGPLVADSAEIASSILAALCSIAEPEEEIGMDIPSLCAQSITMVTALGFTAGDAAVRMCTAQPPTINASQVYAQLSLEIG